jgi:hypothetical protein
MSFIHRDSAELTKQLQRREPSPKHEKFMDRLLKYAEQEGKQVARVGYIEPPIYCIVDDDLQPTESTNMQSLKRTGLLAAIMGMLPSMAHSYGHPMQVQPEPQLIASTPSKPRRRNHTNGGTHKQNLRASKRNGKQYKVRKQA